VRRTLVAGILALALLAGAARAALLLGTPRADTITGSSGSDTIEALAGNDRISTAWDDKRDVVNCGLGQDAAECRPARPWANCETVSIRLSRDRTTAFDAQHETQVEPDSFAVGSTIVTAFQTGRVDGGGAAAIGWATSTDAGKHWRAGTLAQSRYELVSDPVVAYDATHATWLVAALGSRDTGVELWVSRSRDGVTWSQPIVAAGDAPEEYDKEWVACDNSARSQFKGRCYLAYVDFAAQLLGVGARSTAARRGPTRCASLPGPARRSSRARSPSSAPTGRSSSRTPLRAGRAGPGRSARVGGRRPHLRRARDGRAPRVRADADLRSEGMPSADADTAGKVYLVWSDSRLREDGVSNDVVLSTSANGFTWSSPRGFPAQGGGGHCEELRPAGDRSRAEQRGKDGEARRRGLLADVSRRVQDVPARLHEAGRRMARAVEGRRQDVGAAAPPVGGADTARVARDDDARAMLGDYISVSWAGGRPWAILPLATRPAFGYAEAIFAATAP
jgi:hypothetical protein